MELNNWHIDHQRRWSDETFGPGPRTEGVLKHIEKEVGEVRENPDDESEWADLLILVIDGATRRGINGDALLRAYHRKMHENRRRRWPDWRNFSQDEPIEHIRDEEVPTRLVSRDDPIFGAAFEHVQAHREAEAE